MRCHSPREGRISYAENIFMVSGLTAWRNRFIWLRQLDDGRECGTWIAAAGRVGRLFMWGRKWWMLGVADCLNVWLTGPNDLANGLAGWLAYAHLYWLQIQFDGPAAACPPSACLPLQADWIFIYTHVHAAGSRQGGVTGGGPRAFLYSPAILFRFVRSVRFARAARRTPRRMRYNNMYTYAHNDKSK